MKKQRGSCWINGLSEGIKRNWSLARRQIAPPNLTCEVNNTTWIELKSSIYTTLKRFTFAFKYDTSASFIYTAVTLGRPAGLSKEEGLYVGAYWLTLSVSQRVTRGQFYFQVITCRDASHRVRPITASDQPTASDTHRSAVPTALDTHSSAVPTALVTYSSAVL